MEVEADNRDGVASTRPQRTIVPARLQDYEVVGDDEVTTDRELVHFYLHAAVESMNYSKALKNQQWK